MLFYIIKFSCKDITLNLGIRTCKIFILNVVDINSVYMTTIMVAKKINLMAELTCVITKIL